ncbi:MAG: DNA methylase [Armatimonadia bacterium]|nr:DNA methylase [Armatimonadia bacterium]
MIHRFHAICPYFAMFPETFPETWISRLTAQGDLVMDPFAGRGTTPFQALLMGRRGLGADINPVASCITRAKLRAPRKQTVLTRIDRLEGEFETGRFAAAAAELPPFFHAAFHPRTLEQILYLRETLQWRGTDSDSMIAALILGRLHGETKKSRHYLSAQMPRTISPKPEYALRFWKEHGYQAPERDVFSFLREQLEFRYASAPPPNKGRSMLTDVRCLPQAARAYSGQVTCAITSPPYLDTTRYEEDQWLRLWFLGGEPRPTYTRVSRDDRHANRERYWAFIGHMWQALGEMLAPKGYVVVRLGGRRLEPEDIVDGLTGSTQVCSRTVHLVEHEVSPIGTKQTHAFRPGSKGCAYEVDCVFRMD